MLRMLKSSRVIVLVAMMSFVCAFVIPTLSFAEDTAGKGESTADRGSGSTGAAADAGAAANVTSDTWTWVALIVAAILAGLAAATGG